MKTISSFPAGAPSSTIAARRVIVSCPPLTLEPSNLFIVADGMGGQQAGEQASLMAVELIPRAIARRLAADEKEPGRIKDAIRDAVADVNQEIIGSSGAIHEYSNMGTTVVLAQFRFDRVFVAGIGDSRAYRSARGPARAAYEGPLAGRRLLDAGTITAEELPNHKFKNVLVSLPWQQGRARRTRRCQRAGRAFGRQALDGQ